MITHLDLFAGIGGFSRAVHWLGGTTVGFVEWDSWNRRVLAKHWPEARFHGDIRTFTAATLRDWGITAPGVSQADAGRSRGPGGEVHAGDELPAFHGGQASPSVTGGAGRSHVAVDLITGGYPCQPFSLAGQRLGAADDRHLWPEMRRVVNLVRPRWVLAENVAGHITMGLDTVLAELEADGYACGAVVVPACAVNALHRRDRVWIMAHAGQGDGGRWPSIAGRDDANGQDPGRPEGAGGPDERGSFVADAEARGVRRGRAPGNDGQPAQRGEGVGDAMRDRSPAGLAGSHSGEERRAGIAVYAGGEADTRYRAKPQTPWPLDASTHGLSAGLVRRPAAGPAEPDLIRAAWADGSWEAGLPRVVTEEPERRQKLQAAGNAIVPLVAYEILRVMMEVA